MPFSLILPSGYGYVATIALGVIPLMSWVHGSVVTSKRKAAGVSYPNAYATAEQAKAKPEAYSFNCAQRAHANFLENMPQTIFYILFAGAFYPQQTVYAATAWIVCKIIYGYGYITSGKPNGGGRLYGGGFWLAQGYLWAMCLYAAFTKLI